MSEIFPLYFLLGCALALLAWPVYTYMRGRMDLVGLSVCLSIPILVAVVMVVGSSVARAQSNLSVAPGVRIATPPASQIAGPYSHWFPPGQTGWVLDLPPRVSPVSGSGGGAVNVGGSGTAVVTRPNAPNINVPVNVNTRVPSAVASAAAARAATIARGLAGPVGAAFVGWQIYTEIKNSGVHTCPPPDFFCLPPKVDIDREQTGWRRAFDGVIDSIGAHESWAKARHPTHSKSEVIPSANWGQPGTVPTLVIRVWTPDRSFDYGISFPQGAVNQKETPGPPMPEGDIATKMAQKAAADSSGQTAANQYNAAVDADTKMRQAGEQGIPQSVMQPPGQSQTSITSPPVTVSNEPLGTKTVTNPDGSQSTTTSTGTATVTPTVTGNGSSTTITYNYNYQITNVTQGPAPSQPVTNTETIIVRVQPDPPPAAPPAAPIEFPKDYNKEATQLRIENLLKGEGVPDGTALSSEAAETSIKGAQAQLTGAVNQVTPEGLGLVSWLPSIPTTQCVNPTVPNPISGEAREVEICEPVNLFSKFISAVICVFVLYGCVREVQGAVKS